MLPGYTDKETPNLDSLLSDYGIALAEGLVLEGDSQHHLPNYPYYLLPTIQSSTYTSDVSSRYVLLAFAQGMTESPDISGDLTYESLLTTPPCPIPRPTWNPKISIRRRAILRGPLTWVLSSPRPLTKTQKQNSSCSLLRLCWMNR